MTSMRLATFHEIAGSAPPAPSTVAVAAPGRPRRTHPVHWALVVAGLGLLVQAVGYAIGWQDGPWTPALYLGGLTILVAPFCWLLPSRRLTHDQRVFGVLAFGVAMYLSFLLGSPLLATRFDETLHVTTLVDLIGNRSVFSPHTFLPVSPYYPGLELATSGVHWLTGLPLMACQVSVVLLSRILLVLGIFSIVTRLARSERAGGIAVLAYGGCSQFWLFNAQFAYETLAFALAVAVVVLLLQAVDEAVHWPARPLIGAGLAMTGCCVTHHVTSWITVVLLWAWGLTAFIAGHKRMARLVLSSSAVATVVLVGWTMLVWQLLSRYLLPEVTGLGAEMRQMLQGHSQRSVLGAQGGAPATPLWQLGVMFAAMLIWCVFLACGGWQVLRRRLLQRTWTRWVLLAMAALFPIAFTTRFMPTAAQIADRGSAFVAIPAALLVAAWIAFSSRRMPRAVLAPLLLVLVVGGVMLGSGADWERVNGPYLAAADQRSIDAETVAIARWTEKYVPPGSRIAADVTLTRFLPNYADVVPDTGIGGGHNVGPIFYDKTFTPADRQILTSDKVDFLYVDTRMAGRACYTGSCFESGDPSAPSKLTAEELGKFAKVSGFHLVLNGPIQVYDLRDLRLVPRTFSDRPSSVLPGTLDVRQMLIGLGLLTLLMSAAVVAARRTRWTVGRLAGRGYVPLAVAAPVLSVIGAVGVSTGFNRVAGSAVLALAVGLAFLALRPSLSDRSRTGRRRPDRAGAALTVLVVAIVAAAVACSVVGEWHGLLETGLTLPAPTVGGP